MCAPFDCFLASVAVPAVALIGRIPSLPLVFGLCCASSSVACYVLCGSIIHNLFSFQPFCVDARLKVNIFGASSFAAAIQSLPGDVFRRRQHLTALPGLI